MVNDINWRLVTLGDNLQDGKGAVTSQGRKIELIQEDNQPAQRLYVTHFKMFYLKSNGKYKAQFKKLSSTGTIKIVKFSGQPPLPQKRKIKINKNYLVSDISSQLK